MLGGVLWVPSALRSSDSTMTMRVNAVIITSRRGRQRQHGDQRGELHHPAGGAGLACRAHRCCQ
jgi:hypothetical protein